VHLEIAVVLAVIAVVRSITVLRDGQYCVLEVVQNSTMLTQPQSKVLF
jgi:hypothetical protein